MSIIAANYESEIVSMYLRLMMHAGIFWIPPCTRVIIQKPVMPFCIANTAAAFHNAAERGTPIR